MNVKITDIDTGETYVATEAGECRGQTDKSGYIEAVASGEIITMGHTIFEPQGAR